MIKNIALASLMLFTLAEAKDYGTVNGEVISDADISMIIAQTGMTYDALDDAMKKRVLDMVVEKKLLTQAADKSGIDKSEAYTTQLKSLKRDLALDIYMKKKMTTLEDSITSEAAQKFYATNQTKYSTPKKLQARHILLKTEEEAKALVKELDGAKDKKATFIELAKTKSTGPSGKNGGDLGWFELNRMVPEFSAAADKLKVGEYTKAPVKTEFGFHLIMLDGKKEESVKPFKEVEEDIKGELGGEAFAKALKEEVDTLKKSAKIELK